MLLSLQLKLLVLVPSVLKVAVGRWTAEAVAAAGVAATAAAVGVVVVVEVVVVWVCVRVVSSTR